MQVDSIIKIDKSNILRYDFIHYTIDELLREQVPYQSSICLFYDPEGINHIFIQDIKMFGGQIPFYPASRYTRDTWTSFTGQNSQQNVKYTSHPLIAKYLCSGLTQGQLQSLAKLHIVTFDQIRVKCVANLYMEPDELLKDIFRVIAWNQIYRAKSANSYIYLGLLLENVTSLVNKKKYHKKFQSLKARDFQKLLQCQLNYKAKFQKWPYIPDKFREYQQIDHYVPTPQKRTQYLEKRINTKKVPVECPQNCVCYCDQKYLQQSGKRFCVYTLKDGWVSQCPNRVNKIECNHENPQIMQKCRNSEIKKHHRRKCRTNDEDTNPQNQIQECIMWGLDLYTRNIIYHTLPQADVDLIKNVENKDSKNQFIEGALLKAINFKGQKGYDLGLACQLIIDYQDNKPSNTNSNTNTNSNIINHTDESKDITHQHLCETQSLKLNPHNQCPSSINSSNSKYISFHQWQQSSLFAPYAFLSTHGQQVMGSFQQGSTITMNLNTNSIHNNNGSGVHQNNNPIVEVSTNQNNDKNITKDKEPIIDNYNYNYNYNVNESDSHNNNNNAGVLPSGLFTQKDKFYAKILLKNYQYYLEYIAINHENTAYRIHTKGKGARCIKKQGIKQGNFIVEYFGELYQPWRWYEREDFIKQVLKKKKLKNFIPQFYNIYLQHHIDDPEGYDLLVVDPNKKGNFSSRFSHSCNPNCGTVTTISNNKYHIAMYSFRDIKYGQQLTFDYCCMTESSYEHVNSICLCGMGRCRGNYLELANNRTYSLLVDKNTCFLARNSLILQALEPVTQQDIKLCHERNIKDRMLADCPEWIVKWTSKLLIFIESELNLYKNQLIQKWTKQYPWQASTPPQTKQQLIQLYSETSKNDLFQLRFQNLFTTVDKMKYFLNTIQSKQAPLVYLDDEEIYKCLVLDKESVLKQIEEVLIEQQRQKQSFLLKKFRELIIQTPEPNLKLFYFRLCCLCLSHLILLNIPETTPNPLTPSNIPHPTASLNVNTNTHHSPHNYASVHHSHDPKKHPKTTSQSNFNYTLLSDILYFYAFTHTYFTATQYQAHTSQQIRVSLMEITGRPSDNKVVEKIKKRYSSQFVWGQLVSWFKQTIVSPEASLSQDRRGTLSYPMIKSIGSSRYPFEGHNRKSFLKAVRQKAASSWPCAPQSGCLLSFKNTYKCYGTVFFQSIHNANKFKDLLKNTLLETVLDTINTSFEQKLSLFKQIQQKLANIGELDQCYMILDHVNAKYFSFVDQIRLDIIDGAQEGKTTKKRSKGVRSSSKSDSNQ